MESDQDDDCVSKKPWGEVLSRSLKLFTFNAAREGGKSFGRVVFYLILGAIVLFIAAYVIDSITGWFGGWFDFWPFNRAQETVSPLESDGGWFNWGGDEALDATPAKAPIEDEARWYCRWNPIC
ncbi:MAG: hypothetical protein ABJ327_21920 [Litoreibacter sp.]